MPLYVQCFICIPSLSKLNHSIDGFSDRELRELVDFVKKQRRKSGITMPSPRRKKIYPNDICPCGSGMKYKKCCGRTK